MITERRKAIRKQKTYLMNTKLVSPTDASNLFTVRNIFLGIKSVFLSSVLKLGPGKNRSSRPCATEQEIVGRSYVRKGKSCLLPSAAGKQQQQAWQQKKAGRRQPFLCLLVSCSNSCPLFLDPATKWHDISDASRVAAVISTVHSEQLGL